MPCSPTRHFERLATTLNAPVQRTGIGDKPNARHAHFPSILYVINCIYNYNIFLITAGRSPKFTPSAIFGPLYGDKLSVYYYQIFNEYYDLLFIYLLLQIVNHQRLPFQHGASLPPPTKAVPSLKSNFRHVVTHPSQLPPLPCQNCLGPV